MIRAGALCVALLAPGLGWARCDADADGDGWPDALAGVPAQLWLDADGDGLPDALDTAVGGSSAAVDTDGDGLTDGLECVGDLAVGLPDTDGDGRSDGDERRAIRSHPALADTDGDGRTDGDEVDTDPLRADTDGDGLGDGDELARGTDPLRRDTDGGGAPDGLESVLGADPLDAADDPAAPVDTDGDGLWDAEEALSGADPVWWDTDLDGLADGLEVAVYGTHPGQVDTDGDGLTDLDERFSWGTWPLVADSDGDGLSDGDEVARGGGPLRWDADADALCDGEEALWRRTDLIRADADAGGTTDAVELWLDGTDPADPADDLPDVVDPDGDGLADRREAVVGTDPANADTDGDGVTDGVEAVVDGTDPRAVDTDGDGLADACDPRATWIDAHGGAGSDFLWDLAVDPRDGSVVVVGKFRDAFNPGDGQLLVATPSVDPTAPTTDVYVARYSADGWPLWAIRLGGPGDDGAEDAGVAIDAAGAVYVGTTFRGPIDVGFGPVVAAATDGLLIKLDPLGAPVWARVLSGTGDERVGGVAFADGVVWVGASFGGTLDLGTGPLVAQGPADLLLAGWTADGALVAAAPVGGAGTEHAYSLAIDAAGRAVVAGSLGGTSVIGASALTSAGSIDLLAVQVDPASGAVDWARRFGGASNDLVYDVVATPEGPVLAGFFKRMVDFGGGPRLAPGGTDKTDSVALALDGAGNYRWDHTFGGDLHDQAMVVARDPATGELVVGGSFAGTVGGVWLDGSVAVASGSSDAFLLRYDGATGARLSTERFASAGAETFRGAAVFGADLVYGGHSGGSLTIDGVVLPWFGGLDLFVGRRPF